MKEYKRLLIIKHALQDYVEREGASQQDRVTEQRLLDKISDEVEFLGEKYRIQVNQDEEEIELIYPVGTEL